MARVLRIGGPFPADDPGSLASSWCARELISKPRPGLRPGKSGTPPSGATPVPVTSRPLSRSWSTTSPNKLTPETPLLPVSVWSYLISLVERPYPAPQRGSLVAFLSGLQHARWGGVLLVRETTDHRKPSGSEAVGLKAALEGLFQRLGGMWNG